jgi:hypothetical protein
MQIEREKFLSLLNSIRPGIARKDIIEHSTHFVFTGRWAVTYNEQICVCSPSPLGKDFICSIQAEEFYKFIKSLRAEMLDLSVVEEEAKHVVKIVADRVEAEFSVSINESITGLIKKLKIGGLKDLWKPVDEGFVPALKWCLFSASQDATQTLLTCIHIKKKLIESSDDMRVSRYVMAKSIDADVLIPAVSVEELVKFDVTHFCIIDPWVYFKTASGAIFCTHLVDGKYPEAEEFFKFDGSDTELPGELGQALESAEIMAAGDFPIDKRIKISIDKGMLTVFAENENLGWVKTKVKMAVKDSPAVSFIINPIFLREILSKTNTVKIGEDRALFQTDNFQHLVSLHGE